jgi:hypothetical protein
MRIYMNDVDGAPEYAEGLDSWDRYPVISTEQKNGRAAGPQLTQSLPSRRSVSCIRLVTPPKVATVHAARWQLRVQGAVEFEIKVVAITKAKLLGLRADSGRRPGLVVRARVVCIGFAVPNADHRDTRGPVLRIGNDVKIHECPLGRQQLGCHEASLTAR